MNTIEPMVVPSPLGWEPLPAPPRRRWLAIAVPVLVFVILLAASVTIVLPYYAIAPGSAREVTELVVADTTRYPPKGEVLLTTVSLGPVRPLDAFIGWLDRDVDIVPREQILPPRVDGREYREINVQLMDASKQTAIVVALRRLGHEIRESGEGALVVRVFEGMPAEGRLRPGDIITAVNGRPTPLYRDAVGVIRSGKPGDTVRFDVKPPGDAPPRVEEVVLAAAPDGSPVPVVGVELRTHRLRFDMPFDIDIRSGNIGGPSAGLAFTLGVLDVLTEGELTGGVKVAATGTINIDGSVGDVGGVTQKAAAVREAGAQVFLVPPGEYEQARARLGDSVRVVRVANLQEALDALGSLGGQVSALGPPAQPPQ